MTRNRVRKDQYIHSISGVKYILDDDIKAPDLFPEPFTTVDLTYIRKKRYCVGCNKFVSIAYQHKLCDICE